jgi:uncharacterized protein (TIGR02246 family)
MELRLLAHAGLASVLTVSAFAQEKVSKCDGPQDACQQNVELWKNFEIAFNKRDPDATTAIFTEDTVWVLPFGGGMILHGRQEIEKNLSDAFKAGFSNNVENVDEVHVIGDLAWVVGHWNETGPGPNQTTKPYQGLWGSVHVRQGNAWKVRMSSASLVEPKTR